MLYLARSYLLTEFRVFRFSLPFYCCEYHHIGTYFVIFKLLTILKNEFNQYIINIIGQPIIMLYLCFLASRISSNFVTTVSSSKIMVWSMTKTVEKVKSFVNKTSIHKSFERTMIHEVIVNVLIRRVRNIDSATRTYNS